MQKGKPVDLSPAGLAAQAREQKAADLLQAKRLVCRWAGAWLVDARTQEAETTGRWTATFLNGAIPELEERIGHALTAVRDAARAEARLKIAGLEAENRELRKPFDDAVRFAKEAGRAERAEEVRQLREAVARALQAEATCALYRAFIEALATATGEIPAEFERLDDDDHAAGADLLAAVRTLMEAAQVVLADGEDCLYPWAALRAALADPVLASLIEKTPNPK